MSGKLLRMVWVPLLLLLLLGGCGPKEPAPEIRNELTAVASEVPLYPGAKEISRKFEYHGQDYVLVVRYEAPNDEFGDEAYRKTLVDSGWSFVRINGETRIEVYKSSHWGLVLDHGKHSSGFEMGFWRQK